MNRYEYEEAYQKSGQSEKGKEGGVETASDFASPQVTDCNGYSAKQQEARDSKGSGIPRCRFGNSAVGRGIVDCFRRGDESSAAYCSSGQLTVEDYGRKSFLAVVNPAVDAAAERKVDAELIPRIVAVVMLHDSAETVFAGHVACGSVQDYGVAESEFEYSERACGAVVFDVVVAVGAVFGEKVLADKVDKLLFLSRVHVDAVLDDAPARTQI